MNRHKMFRLVVVGAVLLVLAGCTPGWLRQAVSDTYPDARILSAKETSSSMNGEKLWCVVLQLQDGSKEAVATTEGAGIFLGYPDGECSD